MNTNNLRNIVCPTCGHELIEDTSLILTTHPPQTRWNCPTCGYTETRFTGDKFFINPSNIEVIIPSCDHDFKVEVVNGELVSVCRKCGKIGDRRKTFEVGW